MRDTWNLSVVLPGRVRDIASSWNVCSHLV